MRYEHPLVLKAIDNSFDGEVHLAVVDLREELLHTIKRRREVAEKAHREDSLLWEMRYWHPGCDFYKYFDDERFEDFEGHMILPHALELDDEDYMRSEIDCMVISLHPVHETGVYWTAVDKYTDFHFETHEVRLDLLSDILKGER